MNRKKTVYVFALISFILVFTGCNKPVGTEDLIESDIPDITIELSEPELSIREYVYDDNLGFGFEYPEGWGIYETGDDYSGETIKKNIIFEKTEDMNGSEVSVSIDFSVEIADSLDAVANEFKNSSELSGIPILSEDVIEANGLVRSDISTGIPSWNLRQVTYYNNGIAYIFKYSSQMEFYNMYEEIFNEVINSFTIK